MPFTNLIKDALPKDESTAYSFNLAPNPMKNVGPVIDAAAPTQMHKRIRGEATSKIMRRLETGEDNNSAKSTEQPEGSISTQAQITQEVQTPNPILPKQRDQLLDLNAVISGFKESNSNLAAVEKHQENTLKYQDIFQIQKIQYELRFRQPTPINDKSSVDAKPPLDALPYPWLVCCLVSYFH